MAASTVPEPKPLDNARCRSRIQNLCCRSRIENFGVSIDPTHWAEALYAPLATQCPSAQITSRYMLLERQYRAGCPGPWVKSLAKVVDVKLIKFGLAIASLALIRQWARFTRCCQKRHGPCYLPTKLDQLDRTPIKFSGLCISSLKRRPRPSHYL